MPTPPMVAVITTIQKTTPSVEMLLSTLGDTRPLIVVGDRKGPKKYDKRAQFWSIQDQEKHLSYRLAKLLPENSYTRKNLGYLMAMETGTTMIYETDDDNAPLPGWEQRYPFLSARDLNGVKWANVYRAYTDEHIWPRGMPPEFWDVKMWLSEKSRFIYAPIQQGLANGSPDVDAVWRLTEERPVLFTRDFGMVVRPGTWSPFNSQSTWWWEEAYGLMYLPSFCSWRASDIIRSYVAQRVLWERDIGIVYHGAEVHQDRNEHDLYVDLDEEFLILTEADRIVDILSRSVVTKYLSMQSNIIECYSLLVREGYLPEKELELVYAWTDDVTDIKHKYEVLEEK